MENGTLSIGGMTCAACAGRIERTVKKIEGVSTATVNLASEKLFVEYDAAPRLATIKEAVAKIGYEVLEKPKAALSIPIGGMTCAACAARVEKAIRRLNGIESVSVNLATEKAAVSYDPQLVRLPAIREVIEKAGYKALDFSRKEAADEDQMRKERDIRILKTKFIIAASLALPLLYIAMAPMITWARLPFPRALSPMNFPLVYGLA
ncbi:MAG: heavy metal translocating P-type ATPase, partial [Treponema sp.]|nr:heavy metal translocating P-type ATPase [Treponema sp.]